MEQKPNIENIKNKTHRSKRGSGITKKLLSKISEIAEVVEDDDPFEDCDSQRWTLEMALEHIKKHHPSKANSCTGYKGGPITPLTFDLFSNSLVIVLFRLYAKLQTELQNCLRIFYFGLENSKPSRYRNLTHSMHQHNIFYKYPWLTTDEKLRVHVDVPSLKKKKRHGNYEEPKPFSEACKQYEIEKRRYSKIQKTIKIEPQQGRFDGVKSTTEENIPNTSYLTSNINEPQIPCIENITDKHLLLSQQYQDMIVAINCNYKQEAQLIHEEIPKTSVPEKGKQKRSRWSSPPGETKKSCKLTPMMHFEKRKIKLTTQLPLSLGDLIVLVSYFYKLEYIEQQLLIEKMKKLETSKPNQASYLRQYVRTTCPLYNENVIIFKPLPQELIISEINMDLRRVTCMDDILENDFCLFDDNHDNKQTCKEFDFGSAFL